MVRIYLGNVAFDMIYVCRRSVSDRWSIFGVIRRERMEEQLLIGWAAMTVLYMLHLVKYAGRFYIVNLNKKYTYIYYVI